MTIAGRNSRDWRRWIPRFSLRQLLLATTLVAVGCYALRWASPWWANLLFHAGLVLIIVGILFAMNRRGATRSFWAGFSACGFIHMLIVLQPGLPEGIPALYPAGCITTWLSAQAYRQVRPALSVRAPLMTADEYQEATTAGDRISYGQSGMLAAGADGRFRGFGSGPFYIGKQDFIEVAHGCGRCFLPFSAGMVPWRCIEVVKGGPRIAPMYADEKESHPRPPRHPRFISSGYNDLRTLAPPANTP